MYKPRNPIRRNSAPTLVSYCIYIANELREFISQHYFNLTWGQTKKYKANWVFDNWNQIIVETATQYASKSICTNEDILNFTNKYKLRMVLVKPPESLCTQ